MDPGSYIMIPQVSALFRRNVLVDGFVEHGCIQIFFWILYMPRMLINILWHPLGDNQYGGPSWRTGSIFSCCKGLWDCLVRKPITTKHQSVFWLISQSRRMSAIFVGICRWISLAAATAAPVLLSLMLCNKTQC